MTGLNLYTKLMEQREALQVVSQVVGDAFDLKFGPGKDSLGLDWIEFYKNERIVGVYHLAQRRIDVFDRSFGGVAYSIQEKYVDMILQENTIN